MRSQLLWAVLAVAGAVAILAVCIVLGRQAASELQGSDRYTVAFADIECASPDSLSRADFLNEVQYLANLPDRLPRPDEALAGKLAKAFAAHPFVAAVEHVEVLPQHVRVVLRFRTPVLAVACGDSLRVVDGKGVLLPTSAPSTALPRLTGVEIPQSAGAAGKPRGDDRVAGAAQVAELVQPWRDRFVIDSIVADGIDLTLIAGTKRIHWGNPPGKELKGEPDAATKARRLCELMERNPGGDGQFDLSRSPTAEKP
jgi:hypothetical protein